MPSRNSSAGSISRAVLVPTILVIALTVYGAEYYFGTSALRARHDLHDWFSPGGWIGQSAGFATFFGFAFLWLYPLRKKLGLKAEWTGAVPKWLDVHIVVGLSLPLLGALHAAWRFDGIIGLGYLAMFVVSLSGVIGRYVYVHIPRSRSGLELSAEDMAQQRRQILVELVGMTGLGAEILESKLAAEPMPSARQNWIKSLWSMVRDDLSRRRAVKELRELCEREAKGNFDSKKIDQIADLARQQMSLDQQARLLASSQALFRHWHTFHKPFAATALIAVSIHVLVVVFVGATWLF